MINLNIAHAYEVHDDSLVVSADIILDEWVNIREPRGSYTGTDYVIWGDWYYDEATSTIRNACNTYNSTGFYNPGTNYKDMDITFEVGSGQNDNDLLVILFRFSQTQGLDTPTNMTIDTDITNDSAIDDDRFTGYMLIMGADKTTGGNTHVDGGAKLVKIKDSELCLWEQAVDTDYILADLPECSWNVDGGTNDEKVTIRVKVEGANIKIYRNGVLMLDFTDPDPIESGSYGFASHSQGDANFKIIDGGATYVTATATFDGNGGSTPSIKSKEISSLEDWGTLPKDPTRTGYTFDGWSLSKTGDNRITSTTPVNVASDVTVYARWTPNIYTITGAIGNQWGSAVNNATVTYNGVEGTTDEDGVFSIDSPYTGKKETLSIEAWNHIPYTIEYLSEPNTMYTPRYIINKLDYETKISVYDTDGSLVFTEDVWTDIN